MSYGAFMFAWNIALLLGQIAVLRRDFKAIALLQIPISVVFSLGIDAFNNLFALYEPSSYPESLVLLAIGVVVLAFGVACTVVANVAMNSGEALVCAVAGKAGWNFGRTKVGFDLVCVSLAVAASLVLLGGIEGVREGTLVAAFATGLVANAFIDLMGGARPPLARAFERKPEDGERRARARSRRMITGMRSRRRASGLKPSCAKPASCAPLRDVSQDSTGGCADCARSRAEWSAP